MLYVLYVLVCMNYRNCFTISIEENPEINFTIESSEAVGRERSVFVCLSVSKISPGPLDEFY